MLLSGEFDVRNFVVEPEAELIVVGRVHLNVEERFSFGDRSMVTIHGQTSGFVVYTNQSTPVYVGVDAVFRGIIEAPSAHVNVAPFGDFMGCIHAESLIVEADAKVLGDRLRPVVIYDAPPCTDDWECAAGEICEAGACVDEPNGPISAVIEINSDWNTGYCTDVTVTNTSGGLVTNWQVKFDAHQSQINNLWNGAYVKRGTVYTVSPAPWNGQIQPGGVQTFGFCADKTGGNYVPTVIAAGLGG